MKEIKLVKKKISDTYGTFLLLDEEIASEKIVLINLYNVNMLSKQIKTFERLSLIDNPVGVG